MHLPSLTEFKIGDPAECLIRNRVIFPDHAKGDLTCTERRNGMSSRIDHTKVAPGALQAMFGLEKYLAECAIEQSLRNLIKVRASQINGCAYCIDMHWKDARAKGESEQRLYGLSAWREAPYYSDRERAALAWTEELTLIADNRVSDEFYERTRRQLSEQEVVDLTIAVVTINAWNRITISFRREPGTYQPASPR
jgi:AhpD family alkylhydroperoxidase